MDMVRLAKTRGLVSQGPVVLQSGKNALLLRDGEQVALLVLTEGTRLVAGLAARKELAMTLQANQGLLAQARALSEPAQVQRREPKEPAEPEEDRGQQAKEDQLARDLAAIGVDPAVAKRGRPLNVTAVIGEEGTKPSEPVEAASEPDAEPEPVEAAPEPEVLPEPDAEPQPNGGLPPFLAGSVLADVVPEFQLADLRREARRKREREAKGRG